MNKNRLSILIRYGSAIGIGLLCCGVYLYNFDFFGQNLKNMFRLLSDGFMLPGFVMVAVGLLVWLANEGTLDGITFVLTRAVRFLLPFGRGEKDENYGEYVERQKSKRVKGYGFLLIVGGGFLLLAALFMVMFHLARG